MSYQDFLLSKRPRAIERGIDVSDVAPHLFAYQAECVRFNLRVCAQSGLFAA